MKIICVFTFLCLLVSSFLASNVSYAAKAGTSNTVTFEKGVSPAQMKAAKEIASAIRSGKSDRIVKYLKQGDDPESIKRFWTSVDELAKIRFVIRGRGAGFIMMDVDGGMSSCNVKNEGGRFVIEGCTFNDGN